MGFPSGSYGKKSACNARDPGSIPGSGRFPGEENGNPLQYSAWEIPGTEEPGGVQSMGSQTVRYGWESNTHTQSGHLVLLLLGDSSLFLLTRLTSSYWSPGLCISWIWVFCQMGVVPVASPSLEHAFSSSCWCLFPRFFDHIGSASGNLVPPPGIRPGPKALDAWSLNY